MSTGPATGTPVIIGNAIEGQTLTVDVSSVSDPDGIQFMGALWQRSTDGGVTFTDAIPFFSPDPTYVVVGADVGALLRVQIGVQDVLGNLSAVFSDPTAPVTSDNHEPTGLPVIAGTRLVGETLTADISGIADEDGLGSFSYSWVRLKDGSFTVVGSGDSYVLTADDVHARLKVIVTYQDGASFTEDVESAFSASIASTPGDVPPRIEFRFGDNKVDENDQGGSVGVLTFDGILDPSLTYTIVSDPAGRFEMNGFELRLTASTSFDFEASATQQVQIRVTDGASLDYTETVTIAVVDKNAIASFLTHAPISDPTVAADVAGLVFPGGSDPLNSPQWVGENVIEVTFPVTATQFNPTGLHDFSRPFSEVEKGVARGIFASVSALTLFGFTEVDHPGGGFGSQNVLDLGIGHLSAGISGVSLIPPGTALLVGDVETHGDETLLGGGFHYTLMHELGHALGLDHGHNNGGTAPPFGDFLPHLPLAHDRSAYSVMTYNNTADGNPQSYMIADIATLQYLYGADFTLNSGDTVYTWSTTGETFINGVSKGATFDTHVLMSIWDGGGNDTYDASNYDGGVEIDLRPGEFSTLSAAQFGAPTAIGNVGNAYLYYGDTHSLIENAIGGDGDDTLMGNVGANRLRGNGGADDLDGGDGTDTAIFNGARANYRVELLGNGDIQVTDLRAGSPDGTDATRHMEFFAFADATFSAATVLAVPGTASDDSYTASGGSEIFDAGIGDDSITFNFRLIDATVSYDGNKVTIDSASSHTILTGFEKYVFTDGTVNNNDVDPLVDDLFYYSQYHDVWNAHADADQHYHQYGWHEGRDPSAFFDTSFYRSVYQDLRASGADPLVQFDQTGWREGRAPSLNFDTAKYLADNADVAAAHIDPLAHFLHDGAQEGRKPFAVSEMLASNGFDYVYYLQHNPDVAAAGVDPFQHFETQGWKEGRNPNALFDTAGYLFTYGDVKAAGVNPLDHYHQNGWTEGRDPSKGFDTTDYLGHYPDVAAAHIDPLLHFLQNGTHEARSAFADSTWG